MRIVGIVGGLLSLLAVVVFATGGVDRLLLRAVAARSSHPIEVRGDLRLRVFSRAPRVELRDVTVGNPHWMPAGTLAQLEQVVVTLDPSLRHPLTVESVTLRGGELRLARLENGASNWTASPPRDAPGAAGTGLPVLHALVIDDVRLRIDDARRHLDFAGTIATQERSDGRLQLEVRGTLNERAVEASVEGEPLADVTADRPWKFRFTERSSGTTLVADGTLPEPFRFDRMTALFSAEGEDLRDLWYLTGVRLPDTARYRFSGHFERTGRKFDFTDLAFQARSTDVTGRISLDSSGSRPVFDADLHSKQANLRDIGKGAAGRDPERKGPKRLFADREIPLEGLRARDGTLRMRVDTLLLGPLTLTKAEGTIRLAGGVATADPLAARVDKGSGKARIVFDARPDRPRATVRVESDGLDLGRLLPGKSGSPPVSGPLRGELDLEGSGRSFDELFAGSAGRLHLALTDGEMRASFAKVMELDLSALGLGLKKDTDRVGIRCAVIDAEAKQGNARLTRLVIDAEPVVISGEGSLSLDSEAVDVTLRPAAKRAGLRLKTAVRVTGTILQPSPRVEAGGLGKQGVAAIALGTVLAPVAAAAAFIDTGRGKDQDCAALAAPPAD